MPAGRPRQWRVAGCGTWLAATLTRSCGIPANPTATMDGSLTCVCGKDRMATTTAPRDTSSYARRQPSIWLTNCIYIWSSAVLVLNYTSGLLYGRVCSESRNSSLYVMHMGYGIRCSTFVAATKNSTKRHCNNSKQKGLRVGKVSFLYFVNKKEDTQAYLEYTVFLYITAFMY